MLRHAAPLLFMLQPSLSCRGVVYGKKRHAAACCTVVLRSAARNNVLLHSVALRIMVHHAMAMFCHLATVRMGKNNNQPVQHWLPLWHSGSHFGLVGSCVFCRGCCFVVFKGGKNNQPVWWPWRSLWLMACWVFTFFCSGLAHSSTVAFCGAFLCVSAVLCAAALRFVPLCSLLYHRAVFVLWCCALCCSNVIDVLALCCAMALHNVPWHCSMCWFLCHDVVLHAVMVSFWCHGIVQCAVALCYELQC